MALTRDRILKPGEFTSLPLCVLKTKLLHPTAKLVYAALLNRLGTNVETFPSQPTIADDCGLSIRCVKYAIAQLKATGLIDYAWVANAVNHYVLNDPKAALDSAKLALSPPDGAGKACTTHSAKLAPLIVQSLPPEPTKLTNKVEPTNSPQPPSAAEIDGHATLNLDQGDNVKLEPHRNLLKAWSRQGRSLPTLAKLETCWKLLAAQEKQTEETFNPDCIQPDDKIEFTDLFKRTASGRYRWQELQFRDLNRKSKSLKQMKKVLDKQGSVEQIEQIYRAYPRKIAKAAAIKAIRSAIKQIRDGGETDPTGFLLERTRLYANSDAGNKGKFTPYPTTWFNQSRYLDNEQEWNVRTNRSGSIKRVEQEDDQNQTPSMSDDDL